MTTPNGITHKQGCPALGGYGHGIEKCICASQTPKTDDYFDQLESWQRYAKQHKHIPEVMEQCPVEKTPREFCAELETELRRVLKLCCEWVQDSDGVWGASCGQTFEFSDGGPSENGARFCYHCGKPLIENPHSEENDDAD